jgi:hypothetical protein
MKLFSVHGTLKTKLFNTLDLFEKRAATLGIHPDELVEQFHHNNTATPAEQNEQRCIYNSRKEILLETEAAIKSTFLSVIR